MVLKKVSIVDDELFLSAPQCVSADMQQFLTILQSYLEYLLPLESYEFSLPHCLAQGERHAANIWHLEIFGSWRGAVAISARLRAARLARCGD